jgi:hypothetical protein
MIHTCFVCDAPASVEVILYDVYSDGLIFFERDTTCPFLCAAHVTENEKSVDGDRTPRGTVTYKYSNKHEAQGFTIYKPLEENEERG